MNAPLFGGALDSSPRHHRRGYADGEPNKEGRHVGLDFYDLLIEGHFTSVRRLFAFFEVNECKGDVSPTPGRESQSLYSDQT